jgi:MFS transporter, DHA1 family, tetracycline resistance protein
MKGKSPLLIIFLTVFLDLVGFGIVLPLLPTYAKTLGASGLLVGVIMAAYSAMQFLFAPAWGAWSDRVGRRPALLISTAGASLSYLLFAYGSTLSGATALWVIFASRIFAGICGANITVAQAYIADVTPPEQAAQRMGLIGMAFGLGFIVGPVVALIGLHQMGDHGPGLIAAGLCAANFVFALTNLPESWQPGARPPTQRTRLGQVAHVMRQPALGFLVVVFFLATFGFTCFETNLAILITANFRLGELDSRSVGAVFFTFAGVVSAFVQAGPISRLVKRLGEPRLVALSLLVFAVGLLPCPWLRGAAPLTWVPPETIPGRWVPEIVGRLGATLGSAGGLPWAVLFLCVAAIAIGAGLTRPPLFALLQKGAPEQERGLTFGVAQSGASLARILGPLYAGFVYDRHPAWPYVTCAGIAFLTGLLAWHRLVRADATQSS